MKQHPIFIDKQAIRDPDQPTSFVDAVSLRLGQHVMYEFAEPTCRFRQASLTKTYPKKPDDTSGAGRYLLQLRPDIAGDTIYLPYAWDEIHSVRLPANPRANPDLPWIDTVITANLSGCCIYVERRWPSNDLIFYHANSVKNSPSAIESATKPRVQPHDALLALKKLYEDASARYTREEQSTVRRPAVYNGRIEAVVSLPKFEYNAKIDDLVIGAQPLNEHRGKVISFTGGTTVAAFFQSGSWEFWFQTWARIEYYFEDALGKEATKAKKKYQEYQVVECQRFYPPVKGTLHVRF
jgi:hypothetical protein